MAGGYIMQDTMVQGRGGGVAAEEIKNEGFGENNKKGKEK